MKGYQQSLIIIILLYLIIVFFSHRSIFTSPYDRQYWQERFEQSQWRLPLSKRIIGDDGLFLYTGDQLIHGADPTSLNAETPPFGKYLIGLFILLFNNGNLYGLVVNILVLIVFFFLTETLLKKKSLSLTATALLVSDPLFTNQFSRTMLDNTQLLLLLFFFLLMAKINSGRYKKRLVLLTILLGIALGFFSATKLPIFSPFLILFGLLLYLKNKNWKKFFLFLISALLAYLLAYLRYFTLGHNFFDWLGTQKWIVSFYRQSLLEPNKGSALTMLFFNQYQNLFTHTRETIETWSLSWPLVAALGTIGLLRRMIENKKVSHAFLWILIAVFTLAAFVVYNLIPFWPRYLLLLLPFFYLGFTAFVFSLQKVKLIFAATILMMSFNWLTSARILFPTPQKRVEQFLYDWRYGFFHDMYRQITEAAQQEKGREEFHQFGQKVYYDAQIEAAEIKTINPKWSRWQSSQLIKIEITYFTRDLGPFSEKKEITVVKEKGLWRISWQWDLPINGLNDKTYLETNVKEAKRGMIIDVDGTLLAYNTPNHMLWITPGEVDPKTEKEMLKFLEELFEKRIAAAAFHHRYVNLNQPHWPIPIGVPPKPLNQNKKQKLKKFSGIKLTPKLGRIYQDHPFYDVGQVGNTHYLECCSLLYSTTTYDGLAGIEKEKNEILKGYNGGRLVIKDQDGRVVRKIIETERKDGQNIHL